MRVPSERVEFRTISIEDLEFLPGNPRHGIYDESLRELASSIAREGLVEPIVVRPKGGKYEVVAGERRVRAAILSNIPKLPAIVREGLTDEEASRLRLVENMKRKDLTLVEKVNGIKAHMHEYAISLEKMAEELGAKPSTIQKWFGDVERLSPRIKGDIAFLRKLSPDVLALLGKYEFKTQERLAKVIVSHKLTDWTARRFTDMFEASPEADLDKLADNAKKQVKTIAVTLPVREAEKVQKQAQEIRRKEQKASKKLTKYLRRKEKKPAEKPGKENVALTRIQVPFETPSVKKLRDIEIARASDQYNLTGGQIRKLEQLAQQYSDTPIRELAERVQKEEAPQLMVIEAPAKLYNALEAYARSEEIFVKEAVLALIEEGLENHGLWKRAIKP